MYLIAGDSLLSCTALESHYAAVESLFREQLRLHEDLNYLGSRPTTIIRPLTRQTIAQHFDSARIAAAFRTVETAIDPRELARMIRDAIAADSRIEVLAGHKVTGVERLSGRFKVEGENAHGSWKIESGQIVNALWESRFRIDETVGLHHPPGWLHRMKYRVTATLPDALRHGPSATMVLGPYGDVVIRPDHTACFSWYPIGLRGWSQELAPPEAWNRPCRGELTSDEAHSLAAGILGAIDAWYPGTAQSQPIGVDAGAIVAYGRTDVDDPASGLHCRTRVGVTSIDGYHSVDPGKLTTAPMFGVMAARRVLHAEIGV